MFRKLALAALALIAGFLLLVSLKDGHFRYERSGVINAPTAKIFPYLSQFKLGSQWNPYDKKDPDMKRTFTGTDGAAGSAMEFEGNKDTGSGKLEMMKVVPNESVEIKLTMLKPFYAENMVEYKLAPEGTGTKFTWTMSGDGGFFGKLLSTLMDCEKMITADFVVGINNLKALVEAQK